jgi:tetratricopeptide (TPR) repeat protein
MARTYLDEGLALSASEPFMRWRYLTRLLIAQGYLALGDGNPAEALSAADKALDLARNTKARKNIARSCSLRGKIHLASGETDKARAALRQALAVTQKLGVPGMIWPCQLALGEVEDAGRQPEAAQVHYQAALEIVEPIAAGLTDPTLRQRFLNADPIRKLSAHARA